MNTQGLDEAEMDPALQPAPPQLGSGRAAGQTRGLPVPVSRGGFWWGVGTGRTSHCLLPGHRTSARNTSTPTTPLYLLTTSGETALPQLPPGRLGSSPLSAAPGGDLNRPEFESLPHCELTLPEPQFPLLLSGDNAPSLAGKFLLLPSPPS